MDCSKCPIEADCGREKEEVLESYMPEFRDEIRKNLKDYCPLKDEAKLLIDRRTLDVSNIIRNYRLLAKKY